MLSSEYDVGTPRLLMQSTKPLVNSKLDSARATWLSWVKCWQAAASTVEIDCPLLLPCANHTGLICRPPSPPESFTTLMSSSH